MTLQIKKATGEVALDTATDKANFKTTIKQLIVRLACYGLISPSLATWLIQVGGLRHE
jgi:hypothetical protein